jgi:hypothetical protein
MASFDLFLDRAMSFMAALEAHRRIAVRLEIGARGQA